MADNQKKKYPLKSPWSFIKKKILSGNFFGSEVACKMEPRHPAVVVLLVASQEPTILLNVKELSN